MIALLALGLSAGLTASVYIGYPLAVSLLARARPRPRLRSQLFLPITVIVPAHNEESVIEEKVANIRDSSYPPSLIQIVVASDGSSDRTVELAQRAGASRVLDLPRQGKVGALSAAVAEAQGEILVFTDADCMFEAHTLTELVSNFADSRVGGVTGNEVRPAARDRGVSLGEGLYWRYEQWIKRVEDRVGSTVSACGSLYAVRQTLFRPPTVAAGNDDVLISAEVVRAGRRLAFDEHATVIVGSVKTGGDEFRRKVRVINGGLRTWLALGDMLDPRRYGLYSMHVLFRKILRRLLPFFLLIVFLSTAWLAASDARWWIVFAPQAAVLLLGLLGWVFHGRRLGRTKLLAIPYYFVLANVAAGVAVLSLFAGKRFESWNPSGRADIGVRAETG